MLPMQTVDDFIASNVKLQNRGPLQPMYDTPVDPTENQQDANAPHPAAPDSRTVDPFTKIDHRGVKVNELRVPTVAEMNGVQLPTRKTSWIPFVGAEVYVKTRGADQPCVGKVSYVYGPDAGHRSGSVNLAILGHNGIWGAIEGAREDADGQAVGHFWCPIAWGGVGPDPA